MKFKIGDKVKVIKCVVEGERCKHLNRVFTITEIRENLCCPYILKNTEEAFRDDELELVERQFTKSDMKDGDIVTYRNGSKRTVIAKKLINSGGYIAKRIDNYTEELKDTISGIDLDIIKVERPAKYETVFERKEEILDETEKRYLANVIRPFRKRVKSIVKHYHMGNEYIILFIKDSPNITFPSFAEGTMYKGMKLNKAYTLEELGL
jgi:hypothetical protein